MGSERLTRAQREALRLLDRGHEIAPGVVGVLSAESSALIDGQAWIHWRTARALRDRGLIAPQFDPEWADEISFTDAGRAALSTPQTAGGEERG